MAGNMSKESWRLVHMYGKASRGTGISSAVRRNGKGVRDAKFRFVPAWL